MSRSDVEKVNTSLAAEHVRMKQPTRFVGISNAGTSGGLCCAHRGNSRLRQSKTTRKSEKVKSSQGDWVVGWDWQTGLVDADGAVAGSSR